MSDALNPAELHGQHVELLPARIVLSMFGAEGADGGAAGNGTDGMGTLGIKMLNIPLTPGGGNGTGGAGMSQNG